MCAVTRHTGGTRGVDHGPSSGRHCCEGRQRRSRPRVTSRATMSDRPRAWNASGGTYRLIIAKAPIASRPLPGRRSSFLGGRKKSGRRATAVPGPPRVRSIIRMPRAVRCMRFATDSRNRDSAVSTPGFPAPASCGPVAPVYSRRSRQRQAGPDRGGPAIARSGRIVRPVRRPSDQQTNRRLGGDPREICNQIPSRMARDLSIQVPV